MAYVGEYVGQWVGEWLGQALNPGAMYAHISGSGSLSAELSGIGSQSSGGGGYYAFHYRRKTQREVEEERKRLGIVVEKIQDTEAEKEELKQSKPRKGTERHVRKWLYLALLEEELTRLKLEETSLQARILELLETLNRIDEEQAIVAMMMALAA